MEVEEAPVVVEVTKDSEVVGSSQVLQEPYRSIRQRGHHRDAKLPSHEKSHLALTACSDEFLYEMVDVVRTFAVVANLYKQNHT